jgi:predicted porin
MWAVTLTHTGFDERNWTFETRKNLMKKSLIALAVLAASGAAMAQSSVTLYGIADVVIHKDNDVSAKMTSGGVSTSRWGVKGSEDLGGGLSANFNFEQGIDLTNGNIKGAAFGRQANVGFSGGFGTLKLGKTWNAYDDVAGASNPVFDSVLSPAGIAPSYDYTANPDMGVYYASPDMGGVTAAFSTNFKNATDTLERVTAFNVAYAGGPVAVALGYQQEKAIAGTSRKLTRVNGSYDLGAAKLLAAFGVVQDEAKDFTIGVDVPLSSALVLSTGFTQVRPDAGGDKPNSFGLGVNYSLSKRTSVYGGFRKDNDAAGTGALGDGLQRYGVGVKHTF